MKIGFFIIPNNSLLKKFLYKEKKTFQKKFKKQFFVDHPIHITLCTFYIRKYNLKKIKNLVFENFNNLKIKTSKICCFKDDPVKNYNTIVLSVRKNKNLINLQKETMNIAKNLRIKQSSNNKFVNLYGYPFYGEKWKAHLTISSVHKKFLNDYYLKKLLNKKVSYSIDIKDLYIYEIDKNFHRLIYKIKLC